MRSVFTLKTFAVGAGLVVLTALVYIASFGMWVNRNLVDSEAFVTSAVTAFEEESSQDAIAEIVVVRLIEDRPLIAIAKPLLVDLVAGLLDGERLERLVTAIGTRLHAALFDGSQEGIVVDLTPVGEQLMPPLERFFPAVAEEIPTELFTEIVIVEPGTVPELSPYSSAARTLVWIAMALAIALVVVIVRMWQSKWKAVVGVGASIAAAGLLTTSLVNQARSLTLDAPKNGNVQVLVVNLYDQLAGALKTQGLWLIVLGLGFVVVGLVIRNREPVEPAAELATSTG